MKIPIPFQLGALVLLIGALYIGTQIPSDPKTTKSLSLCELKPQSTGKVAATIKEATPLPGSPNQVVITLDQKGCSGSLILPIGQARNWTIGSEATFIGTSSGDGTLSNPSQVTIQNNPTTTQTFNVNPIILIPNGDDYLIRIANGYKDPIVLTIKKDLSSRIRTDIGNTLTATMTGPYSGEVILVNNEAF